MEPTNAHDKEQEQHHEDISATMANDDDIALKTVALELAQEFNVETLSTPAVKQAQGQIQTVALQMDDVRTQISQIQESIPAVDQQTKALLQGAEALERLYRQIDELSAAVEGVASTVHQVGLKMDEAERDLSTSALQPLQAVLETLKMGPKGFRQ